MHRWTARFLLLVMLVPAIGPLALGRVAPPGAMHCMRRPLLAAAVASSAQPAMHCHQAAQETEAAQNGAAQNGALQTSRPASSETSFRSLDCCCCNRDCCCRGLKTSEWARPATNHLSFVSLLIEPAVPTLVTASASAVLTGPDSARAPPRQ